MSKSLFTLISGCVAGVQTIAVACVTYFNPEYATAINGSIVAVCGCIVTCMAKFVQEQIENTSNK